MIVAPNIVEFDLKGFFDSVRLTKVSQVLRGLGLPRYMVSRLDRLNSSAPTLPRKLKLDESNALLKQRLEPMGSAISAGEESERKGVPQGAPTSPLLATMVLKDSIMNAWNSVMYADDGLIYGKKATAGAAPLPVTLDALLKRDMGDSGVQVHPEKSSWVRKDGVWMKPLLFLGLEYDGVTNTLRGKTRKQRTEGTVGLEYDKDLLVAGSVARDEIAEPLRKAAKEEREREMVTNKSLDPLTDEELDDITRAVPVEDSLAGGQSILDQLVSVEQQEIDLAYNAIRDADQSGASARRTRWNLLMSSKLAGFMVSRLYGGSWSLADYEQDFRLTYCPGS